MGRADGGADRGRERRKSEGLMLAVLATGAPATGSPSIAGHRYKNTLAKPPTLTLKVRHCWTFSLYV